MPNPLLIVNGEKRSNLEALEKLRENRVRFLFIPCWKTMVKVPEEIVSNAEKLATNLRKIDRTFYWKIIRSYKKDVRQQKCRLLVIYSPSNDQAFRRGTYFLHKLELNKFERLIKGYYWVKKYPSNLHTVDSLGEIHGSEDIVDKVKKIVAYKNRSQ
jgi:hypothetical protein